MESKQNFERVVHNPSTRLSIRFVSNISHVPRLYLCCKGAAEMQKWPYHPLAMVFARRKHVVSLSLFATTRGDGSRLLVKWVSFYCPFGICRLCVGGITIVTMNIKPGRAAGSSK